MNKSISFILSGSGKNPVGGFKIVYEYANRLVEKGWKINVVHPLVIFPKQQPWHKKVRHMASFVYFLLSRNYLPKSWFRINPQVRMLCVPNLSEFFIPDADYIVACPVQSAFWVNSYSEKKGKKFYFIQHFEDWGMKKEDVEKSWKLPLKKIVVSQWLRDLACSFGEEAVLIQNGLDTSFFKNLRCFTKRPLKSIVFISHILEFKGTQYIIEAMKKLKEKYPDLIVKSFSVYKKPEGFPDFIEYYQNPSQECLRDLYNSCAMYISPSLSEGWDLPLCESILCGCVAIATNINGHREYLLEGINGFYCIPASTDSIVERVDYVIAHPGQAQAISESGQATLQKYDWDSRVNLLEKTLLA